MTVGNRSKVAASQRSTGEVLRSTQRVAPAGQEIVEMALLIPLLLFIAAGVLDLGRVFHVTITIANAAREGARYGMWDPNDTTGIQAAAQAEAANSGIDLSTSTIAVSCPSGCGSGLPVRVTIAYPFQFVIGMVFPNPDLTLTEYAEMMVP